MSYQEFLNYLTGNSFISYVIIFQPSGEVYWTNNPNWVVDGKQLLTNWQAKMPSIVIASVKYSCIINNKPDYLVAKNIRGGGSIIIAKAPNGYFFLTWTPSDTAYTPQQIHAEVSKMALAFK